MEWEHIGNIFCGFHHFYNFVEIDLNNNASKNNSNNNNINNNNSKKYNFLIKFNQFSYFSLLIINNNIYETSTKLWLG